jgi:hypothetical protein
MKSKASLLFIFGSQTDINTFNNMKSGLVINAGKNSFYDAEPLSNSEFTLFSLSREDQALLNEYPPLQSPFGSYQYSPVSEIMVFQKIANVSTKTPLIMFTRAGERKVGIIAGENIWRWRMANYIRRSGFETFDLLVDKMAIYLSTREDKSFLRIIVKNRFAENEPVEIEAEVFNKSYERVIAPDVNITIMDNEKRSYPFIFSKGNSFYYLRAGYFPVGEYSYVATTKVGNETYQKTGEFIVSEINTENLSLVADHQVLSRIALSHDGTMVRPDSLSRLPSMILQRDEVKSISSNLVKLTDLISSYWVFVLILTLLTVEWVLRKREGK